MILTGFRNKLNGLWDVPIEVPTTNESVNAIINKGQSKKQLAMYVHGCMFSPTTRTLVEAINQGNLISFPGINDINSYKFLPKSMATSFSHLDQQQQGLQSTKKILSSILTTNLNKDIQDDFYPTMHVPRKSFDCLAKIVKFKSTNKAYIHIQILHVEFTHKTHFRP